MQQECSGHPRASLVVNAVCGANTASDSDTVTFQYPFVRRRLLEPVILLLGPPGTGKTMLARRLPTTLPSLSLQEAIETTRICSAAEQRPVQDRHRCGPATSSASVSVENRTRGAAEPHVATRGSVTCCAGATELNTISARAT